MRADQAKGHQFLRVAYGNKQAEVVAFDTEDRPISFRKWIDQANAGGLEVHGITRNHG